MDMMRLSRLVHLVAITFASCSSVGSASSQSENDLLRAVPAPWADTPVVLFKDNLAVIPEVWDSVELMDSPFDSKPSDPTVQKAFEKVRAADFIAWDESFLGVIGPGAKVEIIQTFDGPEQVHEAPVYLPESNELLYSDTSVAGWLWAINVDSYEVRKLVTTPALDNVNGATMYNGKVYLVTNGGSTRGLYSLDVDSGKVRCILNNYHGRRFNSPNDLIFDLQANILFTDPDYGRVNGWSEVKEPELPNAIYHFDTTTRAVTTLSNSVVAMPNGLALSLDESMLYIADSNSSYGHSSSVRNVWAFAYDGARPALGNPRLVYHAISGPPDGLRVTQNGLLMVTSAGGIEVVDPSNGRLLGKINTPGDIIYNLEPIPRKRVWILTGRKHLYKVSMKENASERGVGGSSALTASIFPFITSVREQLMHLIAAMSGTEKEEKREL